MIHRAAAARRLLDLVLERAGHPRDLDICDGWPRQFAGEGRRQIAIGQILGTADVGPMNAPPPARQIIDDDVTIHVYVSAGVPGDSSSDARRRVAELQTLIVDTVQANKRLNWDNDQTDPDLTGIHSAWAGPDNGPDSVPSTEGYLGVGTVKVTVKFRIP